MEKKATVDNLYNQVKAFAKSNGVLIKEIATRAGCCINTLKSRLKRGISEEEQKEIYEMIISISESKPKPSEEEIQAKIQAQKEKEREYRKQYRFNNKEKYREYEKRWRQKNKEKYKVKHAEYMARYLRKKRQKNDNRISINWANKRIGDAVYFVWVDELNSEKSGYDKYTISEFSQVRLWVEEDYRLEIRREYIGDMVFFNEQEARKASENYKLSI